MRNSKWHRVIWCTTVGAAWVTDDAEAQWETGRLLEWIYTTSMTLTDRGKYEAREAA